MGQLEPQYRNDLRYLVYVTMVCRYEYSTYCSKVRPPPQTRLATHSQMIRMTLKSEN